MFLLRTIERLHPLMDIVSETGDQVARYAPFPSLVLADPFPRIMSHIRSVLSCPTLNATLPDGCTATEFTRPL